MTCRCGGWPPTRSARRSRRLSSRFTALLIWRACFLRNSGKGSAPNLFLRLDYDGGLHSNGGTFGRTFEDFGVIAGSAASTALMERYLRENAKPGATLEKALETAANAWAVGHMPPPDGENTELPAPEQIASHRTQHFAEAALETGLLERNTPLRITYRALPETEIRRLLEAR